MKSLIKEVVPRHGCIKSTSLDPDIHLLRRSEGRKPVVKAFTLLETLLVLAVSSFLILLFTGTMSTAIHAVRGELYLAQFEQAYKNTQIQAATTHQAKTLTLSAAPVEVKAPVVSITFDARGNNSSLQKLTFVLPYAHQTVNYQMEMGSGKYKKTIN